MQPPLPTRAPTFYLTGRQPIRPLPILLAILAAAAALASVLYALQHNRQASLASSNSSSAGSDASGKQDDKDDPNQVDTIVLGDPADAPSPGRRGDHVSPVHPTILIRLPRFGADVGLIPDSPTGRLLYKWLAAFNQSSPSALDIALPGPATALQLELRQQTGGFNLVSAKEVQPGVLVFRLRDQTPQAHEVLGTLQLLPGSDPPAIATFSLRSVPSPHAGIKPLP